VGKNEQKDNQYNASVSPQYGVSWNVILEGQKDAVDRGEALGHSLCWSQLLSFHNHWQVNRLEDALSNFHRFPHHF